MPLDKWHCFFLHIFYIAQYRQILFHVPLVLLPNFIIFGSELHYFNVRILELGGKFSPSTWGKGLCNMPEWLRLGRFVFALQSQQTDQSVSIYQFHPNFFLGCCISYLLCNIFQYRLVYLGLFIGGCGKSFRIDRFLHRRGCLLPLFTHTLYGFLRVHYLLYKILTFGIEDSLLVTSRIHRGIHFGMHTGEPTSTHSLPQVETSEVGRKAMEMRRCRVLAH